MRSSPLPYRARFPKRWLNRAGGRGTKVSGPPFAIACNELTQYSALVTAASKLFGLLALFCCALSLAVPAAARGAHSLAHAQAPVAYGEFHTHDDHHDEAVPGITASEDDPAQPGSSEGKAGHSHMMSPAFDLSFVPPEQMPPGTFASGDRPAIANTPALTTLGWSPPVRPPRTA